MTEEVIAQKNRYSPQQTAEIRKAAVQDVLNAQTDMLIKAEHKTRLADLGEVKQVTGDYMQVCIKTGIIPNLEGLCARMGLSRSYVYRYIRENPDSETAQFLNQARLMWASARMSLAERGILDNAMSIFILKNSGLNFADKHDLEIDMVEKDTRPAWAHGMSDQKYLDALREEFADLAEQESEISKKYGTDDE